MSRAMVSEDKIRLGVVCRDKWEAIAMAGELLVASGHVASHYPASMVERERMATTYLGNGVAIPHGTRSAINEVHSPGLSLLQIPGGIDFGEGQICRLVFGLAACD